MCRAGGGVCDVAENCDGSGAAVARRTPSNRRATVCRPAAGVCDVAENCNGASSTNCPADHFAPSSTVCRPANGVCDVADNCPGNGPGCGPDDVASSSVVCRPSAGQCDVAENCDGVNGTCPPDASSPNGTPCNDGVPCTEPDTCTGGSCGGTPYDCDDNLLCTIDSCNGDGGSPLCANRTTATTCPGNPARRVTRSASRSCAATVVSTRALGETCDPPDPTLGPNGQPKCRPDCTSCGDGVTQTKDSETCDDGNLVSGCDPQMPQKPLDDCLNSCRSPICEDPAKIKLSTSPNQIKVHGRMIANSAVDFTGQHYVIQLTQRQTGDVVYRASLLKGSISQWSPSTLSYRNKGAKKTGGIYILKIQARDRLLQVRVDGLRRCRHRGLRHDHPRVRRQAPVGRSRPLGAAGARGWVLNKKGTFLEP